MRMRSGRRLLAGVALVALVAAGCSGGEDGDGNGGGNSAGDSTGVTDTSIKIGGHFPLTGPAAPGYASIPVAMKAYFDYVNENGGVHGRKIDFKYLDDAYNPTQTVQVARQLVLQDRIFAMVGGLGTPTHTKVIDFLNQQKVPDLFVSSGCVCWDQPEEHPYTFGWQPDYFVEGKVLGQYIKDNFAGKRIAYFYQNDDFGADGQKGLDTFVSPDQVVARVAYEPGNIDIAPQVTELAKAKPDVIVSLSIPAYTALLRLGTLKAQLNPQIIVSNVGSDPVTLSGLLEAYAKQGGATGVKGTALIEGMISTGYLPSYVGPDAETNTWTKAFKKIWDDAGQDGAFNGSVQYGFTMAYTFVQALELAGKDLTREKLIEAVKSGKLSEGNPGLAPFRFGADSHAGYTGVQVVQIRKGAQIPLGEVQVTDKADGPVEEFTETQPTAPDPLLPSAAS